MVSLNERGYECCGRPQVASSRSRRTPPRSSGCISATKTSGCGGWTAARPSWATPDEEPSNTTFRFTRLSLLVHPSHRRRPPISDERQTSRSCEGWATTLLGASDNLRHLAPLRDLAELVVTCRKLARVVACPGDGRRGVTTQRWSLVTIVTRRCQQPDLWVEHIALTCRGADDDSSCASSPVAKRSSTTLGASAGPGITSRANSATMRLGDARCYSALNNWITSPSETARAGAYAAPRATASETRAADINVSGSRGLMS